MIDGGGGGGLARYLSVRKVLYTDTENLRSESARPWAETGLARGRADDWRRFVRPTMDQHAY